MIAARVASTAAAMIVALILATWAGALDTVVAELPPTTVVECVVPQGGSSVQLVLGTTSRDDVVVFGPEVSGCIPGEELSQ